ncbi:MAG: cell division protein ZapA [Proteobacteria bacterium]|nr:cell division protein ZapA [Pseudomonadota bacterium]MBU1708390.1 cell division protein ZapA [Pseudomonadota bacterium]
MERLVKFEVLGQEYPLYTDAPEEDVDEILQLVKSQLEDKSHASARLPSHKLAILISLNMAGKYVKLKRDFENFRREVDEDIDRLTKKIENLL